MSRTWNGESLVDELSALLGDTSTAFKARVLGWLNDTQADIGTRFNWGFHKEKGKKKLAVSVEEQSLEVAPPTAPLLALATNGSLIVDTVYKVLVTFGQANGVESLAGVESESITPTGTDLTINLSNIPVSNESLVTCRHLYLKKGTGDFYYHSTIFDNTSTTAAIDTDTTDTTEPPDYQSIRMISGNPYFQGSNSGRLQFIGEDQLRRYIEGSVSTGTPEYFSMKSPNEIVLYPIPSSEIEVFFDYYRQPFRLYNAADSQPDLPINLKPVLKAGVIALGYEYRDREGQESKKQTYEALLLESFNRYGKVADVEYSVNDVYGYEVG